MATNNTIKVERALRRSSIAGTVRGMDTPEAATSGACPRRAYIAGGPITRCESVVSSRVIYAPDSERSHCNIHKAEMRTEAEDCYE